MDNVVEDASAKKELYDWIKKYIRKNDQSVDILDIVSLLQYLGFSVVRFLGQEHGARKFPNKCRIEISCAVTGTGAILECKDGCRCSSLKNYEILDNTVTTFRMPEMSLNSSRNSLQITNGTLPVERKVPSIEELLEVPPNTPLTRQGTWTTDDFMNTMQQEKLNKAAASLLASKENNKLVLNQVNPSMYQAPQLNGEASSDNIAESILGVIQTLRTVHNSLVSTKKGYTSNASKRPPLPTPRQGQSRIPVPVGSKMSTQKQTTARQELFTARQELFKGPVSTTPQKNPYKRRTSLPLTSEVSQIMQSLSDKAASNPNMMQKLRIGSQSSLNISGVKRKIITGRKFERSHSSTKL